MVLLNMTTFYLKMYIICINDLLQPPLSFPCYLLFSLSHALFILPFYLFFSFLCFFILLFFSSVTRTVCPYFLSCSKFKGGSRMDHEEMSGSMNALQIYIGRVKPRNLYGRVAQSKMRMFGMKQAILNCLKDFLIRQQFQI